MADLRRKGLNNQKREIAIAVSEVIATSATMDEILWDIPVNSLITGAKVVVETASGTVTDTVDIKVGTTVIANEVVVGATGVVVGSVTPTQFKTGGQVTVVAGADAPDTVGRIRVVLEYIELDTTIGTYVG